MAYVFEKEKLKLPRSQDNRVLYTEEDFNLVKDMFFSEGYSQRAIARKTGISRRYVNFILFPEKEEHAKALYKERRKDGRYYDREKHSKAMKRLRKKKQALYKAGMLRSN